MRPILQSFRMLYSPLFLRYRANTQSVTKSRTIASSTGRPSSLLSPLSSRGFAAKNVSSSGVPLTEDTCPYTIGDSNIKWHHGLVTRSDKEDHMKQRGGVLWFTGLSGSGKSTIAFALENTLHSMDKMSVVLDGDNMRHGLNSDLGFSYQDRKENLRRMGEISKLLVENGVIVIVSLVSPYRYDRNAVRAMLNVGDFHEIYINTPLKVCEERDPKGLYKLARDGVIKSFTGIDSIYEPPLHPEIVVEHYDMNKNVIHPTEHVMKIIAYMHCKKMLK